MSKGPAWIDCLQNLPLQNVRVLVWDGEVRIMQWKENSNIFDQTKPAWTDNEGPEGNFEDVTHWMPLPDPPNGNGGKS